MDISIETGQYDILTGLPARHHFLAVLERVREERPVVCLLDLDAFQRVNTALGQSTGDRLLRCVADRLRSCLPPGVMLARHGGDSFALLIRDRQDPRVLVRRMQKEIRGVFKIDKKEILLSMSAGIARVRGSLEHPLKNAAAALLSAKQLGRGGFRLYHTGLILRDRKRVLLEFDLMRADLEKEFFLRYQPIIDATTGEIAAFEALLRWEHPEFGNVSPTDFISLAEANGRIVEIGQWVLRRGCEQLRIWRKEFPALRLCVNVSVRQLEEAEFAASVKTVLLENNLDPGALELELTENVLVECDRRHQSAVRQIEDLRGMGVRVAIDDFGTGYSIFSYLRQIPFDTLKIDRSFIERAPESRVDRLLINGLIRLAHDLDLEVITEGVATGAQRDFLLGSEIRPDYFQGYFFAKPLTGPGATEYLGTTAESRIPAPGAPGPPR